MNKGFTLVELIAVITILGLLSIITTPAYDTISKNIKEQNYESKKSTIKRQTLAYAEKYLKDKIYTGKQDGNGNYVTKYYCFTVEYLIQNGIISSDDEKDEYIKNDVTGDKIKTGKFVQIYYDNTKFKLIANTIDEVESLSCDFCDNGVCK